MAGLKQGLAAKKLDVTQGAVSNWETGSFKPRADLLPKIAKLYGCRIDDLFPVEKPVAVRKEANI